MFSLVTFSRIAMFPSPPSQIISSPALTFFVAFTTNTLHSLVFVFIVHFSQKNVKLREVRDFLFFVIVSVTLRILPAHSKHLVFAK